MAAPSLRQLVCGAALSVALVAPAAAQPTHGAFFPNDIAKTTFSDQAPLLDKPELEYFPRTNSPVALEDEANDPKAAAEKETDKVPKAEEIVAKFGDPTKEAPIQAVENAPAPVKGLMAALQEGEDALAFQYAKQYVRHLRNLEQRSNRVASMTQLAMRREGMEQDANAWRHFTPMVEDQILYAKDVLKAAKSKGRSTDVAGGSEEAATIDPKVLALLDRASKEEFGVADDAGASAADQPQVQESSGKEQVRVRRGYEGK